MWAVIITLHHQEILSNKDRTSNLKSYGPGYCWDDISYPTSFNDIRTWEHKNRVRVNILRWDGSFYPIKNEGDNDYPKRINLLQLTNDSDSHYIVLPTLIVSFLVVNSDGHQKSIALVASECLRRFLSEMITMKFAEPTQIP